MILLTSWRVNIYIYQLFKFIIIGIGYIIKDSKNQIKLEQKFNELLNEHQSNIIELNEDNNKNDITEKDKKIDELNKINEESKYLDFLLERTSRLLSIIKNKRKLIGDNYSIKSNQNEKNQLLDIFSFNKDENLIPNIEEIMCIVKQYELDNDIRIKDTQNTPTKDLKNTIEKEEKIHQTTKVENKNDLFNDELIGLFIDGKNNNKTNFELLPDTHLNFHLRKDSFISNISSIGEMNNFIDNKNIFE